MKFMVLGAGRMGAAIAYDLAKAKGRDTVEVADADSGRARGLGEALGIRHHQIDLADELDVRRLLEGVTVAISAADYALNESLTRTCIAARTHMCDLGGSIHVVARQLALNDAATAAGVTVVPDCGLAPGLACLLAARGVEIVAKPERVTIRVGGLPQKPRPPLGYSLSFSVRGLANEYVEPAEVLRAGEPVRVESVTEVEPIVFPPPYGELECFHTSGGASTLTQTLAGKVRELDYKTIRYPGHARVIRAMIEMGFLSSKAIDVSGTAVEPRRVTEALFERSLGHDDEDVVLVRVVVEGGGERLTYELVDRKDPATGHSAMMRTTGYPTAVIALFLAESRITARGVLPGEKCVPVDDLVAELGKRGVRVVSHLERTG